jgi:cellulose synthase/poly-beta-1,6-N-acetylglucosamine synthase-like glycosyltransferase
MDGADTAMANRTRVDLVDELIRRRVLSNGEAERAVELHRVEGGWIGTVLMVYGFVRRTTLYEALADVLGLPFVDLAANPPDVDLVRDTDVAVMLRGRWLPCGFGTDGGESVLTVATADPERVPMTHLAEEYGADRVKQLITTDWDLIDAINHAAGGAIASHAADSLAEGRPDLSARYGMTRFQLVGLVLFGAAMLALAIWRPLVGLAALVAALNLIFDVSIAIKVALCLIGGRQLRRAEEDESRQVIAGTAPPVRGRIPDRHLPSYTILVPCYHEANVLPEVLARIEALDYPRSKKQVLVLLEEDDDETIAKAKALRPADNVRIVILPDGAPRTKPRGCNVGLLLARGEYLVIYDAEDRPEPSQLREVVEKFRAEPDDVVCLQARLNYFNADQNFLTRMFTLEYSMWFDYMLVGVDALGLPMPLGGTSNHFRTDRLRELGGWDPYNVTEDADLGIRCKAHGYRVGTVQTTTWEEACSVTWPWVRQRTRWIKGFMVTTAVHTRSVRQLYRTTGWRGVAGLYFFIGATPATFLINPLVVALGLYGIFGLPLSNYHVTDYITAMNTFSLVFGTLAMVAITMYTARRRKQWKLLGYAFLNPVYWMLHSTAAWRALYQLIRKPSEWEKTPHGLADPASASAWAEPMVDAESQ